jgi:hypothetical protein
MAVKCTGNVKIKTVKAEVILAVKWYHHYYSQKLIIYGMSHSLVKREVYETIKDYRMASTSS